MSEANEIESVVETDKEPTPSLEDRIVAAAKEQGWREGGELDAFEFINRGSQFHRDLKGRVDALAEDNKKAYNLIAEHILSQKKKDHEQVVSNVKSQIKAAATEGDADKVLELTETLKSIPEPVKEDPNMEFIEDWTKENKWFNDNDEMRYDALGFYQAEKSKLGVDDPKVILPKVKARIEKLHEDYFKPKNPNRERASGETSGKMKSSAKGFSENDLDEDERRHFDQFLSMGLKKKDLLDSIHNLRKQRGLA